MSSDASTTRPSEAGFTLIEALVSVAIMVIVLTGLLTLLEFNSRVAKAQINVSDMQQALRSVQSDMVRQARMAGRGGLAIREAGALPPDVDDLFLGPAISMSNNVASDTKIGGYDDAVVRPGTDVLTVRGVLSTPIYQVEPAIDGDVRGARAAGSGSIVVRSVSPTGVPQDLTAIRDAVNSGRPEALILVSSGTDEVYAVVEITGGDAPENGPQVQVDFTLTGAHGESYEELSPTGDFPLGLQTVAMVGLVEEYRYYVREPSPGDPNPRLSRARLYPGTEAAYAGKSENLIQDLADNILDFQVALGLDQTLDGVIAEAEDGNDDWLFNVADDDGTAAIWSNDAAGLFYLRLTTLARTDRLDLKYVSPPITAIEDHTYDEPDEPTTDGERIQRSYRRRVLSTVVDLRNLS